MTVLSTLRRQLSGRDQATPSSEPEPSTGLSPPPGETRRGPTDESQPPFENYDRLDDREVIDGLSHHSQIELEAAEGYERSHKSRERVLDKLRYMRGSEPLADYDALSVEQIVAALEQADMTTIKKVRAYERKFANRPGVTDEIVRVLHRGQATRDASATPR